MYPIKIKAHERNVNIVRFNYDGDLVKNSECPLEFCTALLFSQIFKWFRNFA